LFIGLFRFAVKDTAPGSWLQEFQNFAVKKGQPLDLSMFSEFSYKRRGTSLGISYKYKDTGKSAADVRVRAVITVN